MEIHNIQPVRTIKSSHYIVASVLAGIIACMGAINLIRSSAMPIWNHTASIGLLSVDGSIAIVAALAAVAIQKKKAPLAEIEEKPPTADQLSDLRIPLMLHVAGKKVDEKLANLIRDQSYFNELKSLSGKAACQWVSNNCSLTIDKRKETVNQLQELLKICEKQGPDYTRRFKELIEFASLDPQLAPAFLTAQDKNYLAAQVLLFRLI